MRSSLAILFTTLVFVVRSQNLVPNGDFEQYSSCPMLNSQIDRAIPWFNAFLSVPWGPGPTPDLFNACASGGGIDVPINNYGVQAAHSGTGYGGVVTYMQYSPDFREYMEVELTEPLIAGRCYELSLHLSLAETIGNTACSDIGAYFSNGPTLQTAWDTLPVIPQLDHLGGFVTDTMDWVLVTGIYQAQGGEDHLTLGSFHNDLVTGILPLDTMAPGEAMTSYYFIDDVSLELVKLPVGGDCGAVGIEEPPSPAAWWALDASDDGIMIGTAASGQVTLIIWDLSGKVVLACDFIQHATIEIGHLSEGPYAFELANHIGSLLRGKFMKP